MHLGSLCTSSTQPERYSRLLSRLKNHIHLPHSQSEMTWYHENRFWIVPPLIIAFISED